MKKTLLAGVLFLVLPFIANAATFNSDLHYGSTGADVTMLQEFLTDQGVYSGPISGNFYSLTLAAVKAFQKAEGVTPVSGYFGPVTRGVAETIITEQAPSSEGNAATTTTPVDLHVTPAVTPTPRAASSITPSVQQTPTIQTTSTLPMPVISNLLVQRIATTTVHVTLNTSVDSVVTFNVATNKGEDGGNNGTSNGTAHEFTVELGQGVLFYNIKATANGQTAVSTGSVPNVVTR